MSVAEKTDELVLEILNSGSYLAYKKYQRSLEKNPEKMDRVNRFRGELFLAENRPECGPKELEDLQVRYQDLLQEPLVVEFLSAEQDLVEMMRGIYEKLGNLVQLDLSFLEAAKES